MDRTDKMRICSCGEMFNFMKCADECIIREHRGHAQHEISGEVWWAIKAHVNRILEIN